jgi:hypothetical protein
MRLHLLILAFVLSMSCTTGAPASDIQLTIDVMGQAELGHSVPVTLTLMNAGTTAFRIPWQTTQDGYPSNLRVLIENDRCRLTLVESRMNLTGRQYGEVMTLQPGEVRTVQLPPLNKNLLYHNVWPYAGRADVRAELYVRSNDVPSLEKLEGRATVEFLPADTNEKQTYLRKLAECKETGSFSCHEVAAYFASVTDDTAADALVAALRKQPHLYFFAKSIVAQGRERDLAALEEIAQQPNADSSYIGRAAAALREYGRNGCVPAIGIGRRHALTDH